MRGLSLNPESFSDNIVILISAGYSTYPADDGAPPPNISGHYLLSWIAATPLTRAMPSPQVSPGRQPMVGAMSHVVWRKPATSENGVGTACAYNR